MKIAITVSTYFPCKDGVSIVTKYLAEGLVDLGNEVTVFTSRRYNLSFNENHNGVEIKRIDLFTKYGLYFGDKKTYKNLISTIDSEYDVLINICTQNAFTDVILNEISNLKCKKILYMHGMFDFSIKASDFSSLKSSINKIWKELRWFFYYIFNINKFKKYDCVIQLHEKDYAYNFFKKLYRIDSVVIENAVDKIFLENNDNISFKKPFDKYLICVANYDDNKNQLLAIKEFFKSKIDDNIGLVLIGSRKNSYSIMLEKFVEEYRKSHNFNEKKKRVLILYDIDRNLIPLYVRNALLYIMTSKGEKFPMSIVESMACGVPFVSTDVGIVKYLVGGITCKKNDIHYFIELLINNDLISLYGKLGKKYVLDNLTQSNKIKKLYDIIK